MALEFLECQANGASPVNNAVTVSTKHNQIGLRIRFALARARKGDYMMDFDESSADIPVELAEIETTRHAIITMESKGVASEL